MISHRYKCIFIHIPRCGGTSIERWIEDTDWWQVDPPSKHLLANQARALYAPYWDSYFKFALVRNPAERTRSMLKYAEHFGLSATQNGDQVSIDFTRHRKHFSCPNRGSHIIEHDHRFHKLTELDNGSRIPNSIYGNILDEDLDHIGRLEEITTSTSVIAAQSELESDLTFGRREESLCIFRGQKRHETRSTACTNTIFSNTATSPLHVLGRTIKMFRNNQVARTIFLISTVACFGSLSADWQSGSGTLSTSDKVGIGTETPQWGLHIRLDGQQQPIAWQETIGDHAGGSALLMTKARGTAVARQPVLDNDVIAGMFAQKWDGAAYRNAGTIRVFSDGGSSAGSTPGKITFQTTAAGSTTLSDRMTIRQDGRVGIGTSNPQSLLAVDGTITAKEIEVTVDGWADFVFDDTYALKPIPEVASFIRENRHLPNVPSKMDMKDQPLNVGQFSVLLLQKVEELTLYIVDLEERNRDLSERLDALEGRWLADGSL